MQLLSTSVLVRCRTRERWALVQEGGHRCRGKGTFYCPHPFVCELSRALGRSWGDKGPRGGGLRAGNGLLAGWEVGLSVPGLEWEGGT